MVQQYIIDKTDLPKLIQGEELALEQGNKFRAFCIEINGELTNGDVIKALFPDIKVYGCSGYAHPSDKSSVLLEHMSSDWWNAPYKGGKE